MQKIKVVHCISSLTRGGAEEVVCSLIEALQAKGNYIQHVIYFHDGPHRARLEKQGIHCYQITGYIKPYDPLAFFRFYKLIKKLNPTVIHSALWLANFFARLTGSLCGIKTINSLHNTITYNHDGCIRIIIDATTLFLADTLIAVTPAVAASAPMMLQKKIHIIPNGIDQKKLLCSAKMTRKNLHFSDKNYIIGCVGRFVPVKNHALLIACFAKIREKFPHAHLVLLGSGPLEKMLRTQVEKYALTQYVTFIIEQPAQHYYALFDCFVQPSKNEGLSLALLEALTFSLPVIVTGHAQEHPVITHNKTGLVIQPDSQKELYDALEIIITNKQLQNNLAAEATTLAHMYDLQTMANKYHTLITDCK